MSRRPVLAFLAPPLGLAAAAPSALAQDSEVAASREFDVVYEAPAGCPERSEVVRRIQERLSVDRTEPPAAGVRDAGQARYAPVVIQIEVAPDGTQAELRYSDTTGHEVTRRVRGDTCIDVVDALSLVAAMSLRSEAEQKAAGNARSNEGQSDSGQNGSAPSGVPPSPTVAEKPAPRTAAAAPAAPAPARSHERPPTLEPPPANAQPWRWLAGVQVSATDIVAEETAGGIAALVGIAHPSDTLLSPRFRLSLGRTGPATASSGDDEAEFTLTYVRGEACPLAWPPTGMVKLRPCASVEGGSLEGVAQGLDEGETPQDILWGAISATGAAEVVAFRHLGLELQAGLIVPLVSDKFYIRQGADLLHEIPDYGWMAAANFVVIP